MDQFIPQLFSDNNYIELWLYGPIAHLGKVSI